MSCAMPRPEDVRDRLKAQRWDKARAAYRQKHESDFIIADAATPGTSGSNGIKKLPTYKSLQAEIEAANRRQERPVQRLPGEKRACAGDCLCLRTVIGGVVKMLCGAQKTSIKGIKITRQTGTTTEMTFKPGS